MADPSGIFDPGFLVALEVLVKIHHIPYPSLPPQGIYFEALVEEAFRKIKKPFVEIKPGGTNQPGHDLLVEGKKISLKTQTGKGTKEDLITITKLRTMERKPWEAAALVNRALEHLSRYDIILMLRAIWKRPLIHYQLLEIPVETLRLLEHAEFITAGKADSLAADVIQNEEIIFRVTFDGSDRKCSITNLRVTSCVMLEEWDIVIPEEPTRISSTS